MNLFRTLGVASLVCLIGAGLNGCINAPDYDIKPEIDFKSLDKVHVPRSGGFLARDTLKFAVDFKDGDGDLGLSDDDIKVAPYNQTTGGPRNRGNGDNYLIQPFIQRTPGGPFERYIIATEGDYDGRFLRLDNVEGGEAKPAPLRGTLRYSLPLELDDAAFYPGQVLRFEIRIVDRALHVSNTITTTPITLGP
ncbi:MAG TPA: hypothetical protein VF629_00585 [Hymenobacter sp.]|jgi:hypothetical protein|uniref:hypothetical protein n=1 Tax=Hymenobacter sp. TaxID=1898978 RepID=UPI002EDA6D59